MIDTNVKDVIWTVVIQVPGNTHLRRDQLFEETDSYYSLTQDRLKMSHQFLSDSILTFAIFNPEKAKFKWKL